MTVAAFFHSRNSDACRWFIRTAGLSDSGQLLSHNLHDYVYSSLEQQKFHAFRSRLTMDDQLLNYVHRASRQESKTGLRTVQVSSEVLRLNCASPD